MPLNGSPEQVEELRTALNERRAKEEEERKARKKARNEKKEKAATTKRKSDALSGDQSNHDSAANGKEKKERKEGPGGSKEKKSSALARAKKLKPNVSEVAAAEEVTRTRMEQSSVFKSLFRSSSGSQKKNEQSNPNRIFTHYGI